MWSSVAVVPSPSQPQTPPDLSGLGATAALVHMCKAKRGPGARGKPTTAVGNRGGSVGMWASYAQPAQALKITLPIRAVYNLSTYPHDPPVIHGLLLPVFLLAYLRACHCAAIPRRSEASRDSVAPSPCASAHCCPAAA